MSRFQPGESGNPGGRPKGFSAEVKEQCGDCGERIIAAYCAIAWGTDADVLAVFGTALRISTKDRLIALGELADRGFGRPVQTINGDVLNVPLFTLPGGAMPSVSKM